MNNSIVGWRHGGTATRHFPGFGVQKFWVRDGVNQMEEYTTPDKEGFVMVAEQMEKYIGTGGFVISKITLKLFVNRNKI